MISSNLRFPWVLFLITILLLATDLYLSFTNPVNAVAVKLGLGRNLIAYILNISFIVPIFVSFFFGMWSYLLLFRQEEYSLLAQSILVMTLVLIVGILLSMVRSHFFYNDTYGMYKILTIVINYVYSFGYLISFGLLLYSSKKQLNLVKNWNMVISILITLLIGAPYAIILLTNPDRMVTAMLGIKPSYFLPDLLIILTIILPTILGWFLAIWAAFRLADIYSLSKYGVLSKEGLKNILYGVLFIVFSAVMLEAILSIGTTRFLSGGLVLILVILYFFVVILVIGNFLVLKGARKLIQVP